MTYWHSSGYERIYAKHYDFWGGNWHEILSSWLHMIAMSGSAALLAALLLLERAARSFGTPDRNISGGFVAAALGACPLLLFLCLVNDGRNGEGTAAIVYPIFTIPTPVGSYYLLRRYALRTASSSRAVLAAAGFVALHLGAQLLYEPSKTGGPAYVLLVYPWFALAGASYGLERLFRSFETRPPDEEPQRLAETARRVSFWTGILVVLVSSTTLYANQLLSNSTSSPPQFQVPSGVLVLEWGALTSLGLFIAVRARRIEKGAAHAAFALSVLLSVVSLALALFHGLLPGLAGALLGLWVSYLSAHTYFGLLYYARHGSQWATRCLHSRRPLAPLVYSLAAVYLLRFVWD